MTEGWIEYAGTKLGQEATTAANRINALTAVIDEFEDERRIAKEKWQAEVPNKEPLIAVGRLHQFEDDRLYELVKLAEPDLATQGLGFQVYPDGFEVVTGVVSHKKGNHECAVFIHGEIHVPNAGVTLKYVCENAVYNDNKKLKELLGTTEE